MLIFITGSLPAVHMCQLYFMPSLPWCLQAVDSADNNGEPPLLCTSLPCVWKEPKARKTSTLRVSDSVFQKHDYAKPDKRKIQPLEDYDSRPLEFRGNACARIPAWNNASITITGVRLDFGKSLQALLSRNPNVVLLAFNLQQNALNTKGRPMKGCQSPFCVASQHLYMVNGSSHFRKRMQAVSHLTN